MCPSSVKLPADTTGLGFNLGLQVALFYGRQLLCDMLSHSIKFSPNNGSTSIAINKTFQFDLGCNSIDIYDLRWGLEISLGTTLRNNRSTTEPRVFQNSKHD